MKTQAIVTLGAVVVLGSLAAVAVADPGDMRIDLGGFAGPDQRFTGGELLPDRQPDSTGSGGGMFVDTTEGNGEPTPPDPSIVPLPGPGAMGLLGLGVLAARRRRR